jgi:hypothetical protein
MSFKLSPHIIFYPAIPSALYGFMRMWQHKEDKLIEQKRMKERKNDRMTEGQNDRTTEQMSVRQNTEHRTTER